MSGNRRTFLGAAAVALAAAGIGVGYENVQPSTKPSGVLASEGNIPAFDGANEWLNSPPLISADLNAQGKVVAVQFWTYTCINWLRTLPYVRGWAERCADQGLVVIGVHTPEFSFEHNVDNVRQAAKEMRMDYPIAIDNDYAIWDAFANHYWPALYLVDAMGRIRHHAFGEGAYEESEGVIRQLLEEAGAHDSDSALAPADARGAEVAADWDDLKSPESYLGADRTENFASAGGLLRSNPRVYAAPAQLKLNQWALIGNWTFDNEAVVLNEANGRMVYQFHARDLHLVMGPATPGASVRFRVLIDGLAPGAGHGFDVDDLGNGTLTEQRLHQLIRQELPVAERRFEIEFLDPGVAGYVFTFG